MLHATTGSHLHQGTPPIALDDNWYERSTKIGSEGWNQMSHLFFDNQHQLYAVHEGKMFVGSQPSNESSAGDWMSSANNVGQATDWAQFKFLFWNKDEGKLYGVTNDGHFYRNFPPNSGSQSWIDEAEEIGNAGWNDFKKLLFDHSGWLYGVWEDGKFVKGPPPTGTDDDWIGRATVIGTSGWADFPHIAFHTSSGHLYAVCTDGSLRVALPPQEAEDNWWGRSSVVGTAGWDMFTHFVFNNM